MRIEVYLSEKRKFFHFVGIKSFLEKQSQTIADVLK